VGGGVTNVALSCPINVLQHDTIHRPLHVINCNYGNDILQLIKTCISAIVVQLNASNDAK